MTCVSTIILGHIILIFYLTCLILISTNRHHFTVFVVVLFLSHLIYFLFCLSIIILPLFSIHSAPLFCCCFCYSVYSCCCCLSFVRVNFIYELLGRIVNQLFSMEASCLPRRMLPSDFVTRGSCIIRREAIQRLAAQSMTFSKLQELMESVDGHRTI